MSKNNRPHMEPAPDRVGWYFFAFCVGVLLCTMAYALASGSVS